METEKARAKRLRNNYNLSLEESDKIDEYQHDVCWICGRPEPVKGRRLSTDHSHLDGLIRGRLCSKCNPLIGKLENAYRRFGFHKIEDGLSLVQLARKIAQYLETPPAVQALGYAVFGWPGRCGTKEHKKAIKRAAKSVTKIERTNGR